MIHFQGRHLMGVLECHQLIAVPITTKKKKDTVICPLLRYSNYDRKKKDTVVWPSFIAPFQLPLLRRSNYDRKKTRYSCLSVVTLFQIRPKKIIIIWQVRNRYYDRKKKSSTRLSGGCMIVITTGKKKF